MEQICRIYLQLYYRNRSIPLFLSGSGEVGNLETSTRFKSEEMMGRSFVIVSTLGSIRGFGNEIGYDRKEIRKWCMIEILLSKP